jgi:uncharacterized protein with PIN domain
MRTDFDHKWDQLVAEILSGIKEWRLAHPHASFDEIEEAVDERLLCLRRQILEDAALASAAATWQQEEAPICAECGGTLVSYGGTSVRRLQTDGGHLLALERQYARCPKCGSALFPPG